MLGGGGDLAEGRPGKGVHIGEAITAENVADQSSQLSIAASLDPPRLMGQIFFAVSPSPPKPMARVICPAMETNFPGAQALIHSFFALG